MLTVALHMDALLPLLTQLSASHALKLGARHDAAPLRDVHKRKIGVVCRSHLNVHVSIVAAEELSMQTVTDDAAKGTPSETNDGVQSKGCTTVIVVVVVVVALTRARGDGDALAFCWGGSGSGG